MATFNYRGTKLPVRHGNRYNSIPFAEIDGSSVRIRKTYWTFQARIDGQKVNYKYIGKNMDKEKDYAIKKIEVSGSKYGSFEYTGLNLTSKDGSTLTTSELIEKMLKGNDIILGSHKNDVLLGEGGDDKIYGGGGSDILIGGSGKDRVWGQGGSDTFRVFPGSGHTIIEDFNDEVDRIHLGNGRKGLKLQNRDGDAFLYQRGDLMAVVEDAAGDLQRSGNFFI